MSQMTSHYDDVCKACGLCNEKMCFSLSKDLAHTFEYPERFPQTYSGARFTSDAMDCSLPIALDSHSGCSYGCTYCLPLGTEILMSDGRKKVIERINFGDKVMSYNYEKQKTETSVVTNRMKRREKRLIEIRTKSRIVKLTFEHPVFTKRGWIKAVELTKRDEVLIW